MQDQPFDYAAAQTMPGWRKTLAWPVLPAAVRDIGYRLAEGIATLGFEAGDTERGRALLLAGPTLITQTLITLEAALSLIMTEAAGIRLKSGADEVAFLGGESAKTPIQALRKVPRRFPLYERWARQIARTASWSGVAGLPGALLAPDAFAINHNALLRQEARRSGRRIAYRDADALLLEARAQGPRGDDVPPDEVEAMVDFMASLVPATGALAERLRTALRAKVGFHLALAYADLACLRSVPLPATDLWCGTAGNRVTRAIAFEVLRRGGSVSCFDHGGSTGMLASGVPLALTEGAAASSFVAMSSGLAALCRDGPLGKSIRRWRQVEIKGGGGDPHISSIRFPLPEKRAGRTRVMLVTGAYLGYRQINPPSPRDPVYLDWHLRLAETLSSLPIELLLKPHPEGLFRGQPNPMAAAGAVRAEPFEECLGAADVLIFDFPLSTTFWAAMCSNHPIVFAELGVAPLSGQAMGLIRRRCVYRPVAWGPNGLPVVDRDGLASAIDEALAQKVDPTAFRELFLRP